MIIKQNSGDKTNCKRITPALTPNLRFFFTEIMIGAIMDADALFPVLGEQASRRASEQAKKV